MPITVDGSTYPDVGAWNRAMDAQAVQNEAAMLPSAAAAPKTDLAVSSDLQSPIFRAPAAMQTATSAGRDGVVQFWMAQGAPQHVAEGIADRVNVESGFKPAAWNPNDMGSPSGGLYQHHADRLTRLKEYAAAQGKPWTDPGVQNQFALTEVQGGDSIAAKHWQEILAAPDRKTAEALWTRYFERGVPSPGSAGGAGHRVGGRFAGMGPQPGSLDAALAPMQLAAAAPVDPAASLNRVRPAQDLNIGVSAPSAGTPFQDMLKRGGGSVIPLAPGPRGGALQPIPLTPAPNLYKGYQDALAAVLNGQRRGFGSIFG